MSNITENCQRILKAIFYYQEPMSSLMHRMGWKNKHTAYYGKFIGDHLPIAEIRKFLEND